MEKGILIVSVCIIFIVLVYVIAKLNDAYHNEKTLRKMAESKNGQLSQNIQYLQEERKFFDREMQKVKHKAEALQIDYDRLQTDYHVLEQKQATTGRI